MIKYLDETGIARIWENLKAKFARADIDTVTIAASGWTGTTYTISDSRINEADDGTVEPVSDSSAWDKACIRVSGQSDGSIVLKADGTVPASDISVYLKLVHFG